VASFVFRLNTPRATFPGDITPAEREAMNRHAAYWMDYVKAGTVIAFGPVMDPKGSWGMAVAQTDPETAKTLTAADPVILADLGFSYDILPMPSLVLRPNA
jgi:hypothetical protein